MQEGDKKYRRRPRKEAAEFARKWLLSNNQNPKAKDGSIVFDISEEEIENLKKVNKGL